MVKCIVACFKCGYIYLVIFYYPGLSTLFNFSGSLPWAKPKGTLVRMNVF